MKIIINAKQLKNKANLIKQGSSRHNTINAFNNTKIELKGDCLSFTIVSDKLWLSTKLEVENPSGDEITCFVETEKLNSLINLTKGEDITLNFKSKELAIISEKIIHTVKLTDNEELKDVMVLPSVDALHTVSVNQERLVNGIKLALSAVADPKIAYHNPEFTAINFELSNNCLSVISTDRYRIASTEIPTTTEMESPVSYLINKDAVSVIKNCFNQEELIIGFGLDNAVIDNGETILIMNNGNGKFPDVKSIIPVNYETEITINNKDVLEALKTVKYVASGDINNKSVSIKFDLESKALTLSVASADGTNSLAEVDILSVEGDLSSWEQKFNSVYLIDYLSSTSTETSILKANRGRPALFRTEETGSTYLVAGIVN